MKGGNKMTVNEAIEVLKDYRKGDFVGDDEFCEAIDTVVVYCEEKISEKIGFLKSINEIKELTHPYDLGRDLVRCILR